MPQMARSIAAVLAGALVSAFIVIVLTLATVVALHVRPGHPTLLYQSLNVVFSFFAACVGGFLTARIAGRLPLQHGIALALLMMLASLLSLFHPAPGQTLDYLLFLSFLVPIGAIAGSALVRDRNRKPRSGDRNSLSDIG